MGNNIFIITHNLDNLIKLKQAFEAISILNFTYEIGTGNQLNFLYVHVDATQPNIQCSVYQKATNSGIYLNYNSECPQRYKDATINALIHRTYKISSSWQLFHTHIKHLQQAFINNGYPNSLFEKILKRYLTKLNTVRSNQETPEPPAPTNPLLQPTANILTPIPPPTPSPY